MKSHSDDDIDRTMYPPVEKAEVLERLRKRAEKLTVEGGNAITTGAIGERVLWEGWMRNTHVTHLEDDPDGVLRLSIGEHLSITGSRYCVYRGPKSEIVRLLKRTLKSLGGIP